MSTVMQYSQDNMNVNGEVRTWWEKSNQKDRKLSPWGDIRSKDERELSYQ